MTTIGWILLVASAVCVGKMLSFISTLAETGVRMAELHGGVLRPVDYQNSITPPGLTNGMIVGWVGLAIAIALVWYSSGWGQGIAAIAAAAVLPAVAQAAIPPRRGSAVFVRQALRALHNRSADYAKSGDVERANACKAAAGHLTASRPDIFEQPRART